MKTMFFSRMEDFLEKNIEGFFNRKFSSNLQLAEIEKILDRLLIRHKQRINRAIFVPDTFTITMSQKDFAELNTPQNIIELKLFLYKSVIIKDYFMKKKPTINILKSLDLKLGVCDIKASFSPDTQIQSSVSADMEGTQGTIVVPASSKELFIGSPKINQEMKFASLTITQGPDKDSYMEIGDKQIHIGRRDKNEFIITDINVSRLHAYITFENGRHILHDANSLNGTTVNDTKISSFCLCPGDKIQMGNTIIIYDIL